MDEMKLNKKRMHALWLITDGASLSHLVHFTNLKKLHTHNVTFLIFILISIVSYLD